MPPITRHTVDATLWLGAALPPFAWGASQLVSYVMATTRCDPAQVDLIRIANGVALLAAALGFALCWRGWRTAPGGSTVEAARAERSFIAALGMLLAALFALVILAQALATTFLSGCQS